MRRAFEVGVLVCRACGGRLRLIANFLDPATIRAILRSMGVSTEAAIGLRPAHAAADALRDRSGLWREVAGGGQRLAIGGGDKPTFSTGDIDDFVHRALIAFLSTYSVCIEFHTQILASRGIEMNDAGEVIVRL